jgi:phosphatidylserine decarboxylase
VRPSLLGRWPILGSNERIALSGAWERGFFALVAVGATGVGSIELDAAPELRTNAPRAQSGDIAFLEFEAGKVVRRGERLGGFRLGSCVVLLFESADDVPFAIAPGQAVRVGERLVSDAAASAERVGDAVGARRSSAVP